MEETESFKAVANHISVRCLQETFLVRFEQESFLVEGRTVAAHAAIQAAAESRYRGNPVALVDFGLAWEREVVYAEQVLKVTNCRRALTVRNEMNFAI